MKLHWSPRSPFVRKVMIAAHEIGLADRIICVRTVAATTKPNADLMRDNPLSKLPTLVLDDGRVLFDSRVICEYLDLLHDGPKLFPEDPVDRFSALQWQSLGDGFLDFLLLWRNELSRPSEQQSRVHLDNYVVRREGVLGRIDQVAPDLSAGSFSIGHIALGCALSYLDFQFPEDDWRAAHAAAADWHADFSARPSVRSTEPVDDS